MFKSSKFNFYSYFSYIHVFLLYCTAQHTVLGANPYNCNSYDFSYVEDEPTNYEEYGEFAEILKVFEDEIECQEEVDEYYSCSKKGGFLHRWTKKLKKSFLKKTKKLFKECLKRSKCSTTNECAYTVAKFKRKIDHIYKTGDIDHLLSNFDKYLLDGKNIDSFKHLKDRVRYYYKHKHTKPKSSHKHKKFICSASNPYDCTFGDRESIENMPTSYLIGGVEVFCGCLIAVLPFPGCKWLGSVLAGDGINRIITSGIEEHDRNHPNDPNEGSLHGKEIIVR